MAEFRDRFTHQEQLIEEALSHSQTTMDAGEAETIHWSETRATLVGRLIPQLRRWRFHLRQAKKPIYLFPVDLRRHGLKIFFGVTWRHPNALRLRYQNALTRPKILYYQLRNWLRRLQRIFLTWFARHRRLILMSLTLLALVSALIVSIWLTFIIWRYIFESIVSLWESLIGS
ncbi:MAG: hypothetical protein AAF702_40680 [Chloroflexota bacterium]